jgi:hypothetical protein
MFLFHINEVTGHQSGAPGSTMVTRISGFRYLLSLSLSSTTQHQMAAIVLAITSSALASRKEEGWRILLVVKIFPRRSFYILGTRIMWSLLTAREAWECSLWDRGNCMLVENQFPASWWLRESIQEPQHISRTKDKHSGLSLPQVSPLHGPEAVWQLAWGQWQVKQRTC